MRVLGVIPARFGSTRFPGKPLADIAGKSLVERVWLGAKQAQQLAGLVVATEDERIVSHVTGFGGEAVLTSPAHASGTDRLGEVAQKLEYDYYVNIQGDEPLVEAAALDALIERTVVERAEMSTLASPLDAARAADIENPNVVKVVCNAAGQGMYFSRSPIPYPRNAGVARYLKHIGIYMYTRLTLQRLCAAKPVMVEQAESLEQLRALYMGIAIRVVETSYDPVAVDVPGDIELVLARLRQAGQ